MKKSTLLLLSSFLTASLWAQTISRPMLEKGKTWHYTYHHFEEKSPEELTGEERALIDFYHYSSWSVGYILRGDTTINGLQYMKMYRFELNEYEQIKNEAYFAAYREENGKVYVLHQGKNAKEFLLLDFSLKYKGCDEGFKDAVVVEDGINVYGQYLHRYHYQNTRPDGSNYKLSYTGVEGVGFQNYGLVRYLFEPQYDCLCDYESFDYMTGSSIPYFRNKDFDAPKWVTLNQEEQTMVDQNNQFAFNLFRKARKDENLLLSPLSITFALGMLNNGATGLTQQEINQVLGFGDAGAGAINHFCHKMLTEANTIDPNTRVDIANNIYMNKGYELQDLFVQTANDYYHAKPETRDFQDGVTRQVINQWASDHTEGMIKELLTEEDFDPETVSYLLNAIYFKGAWEHKFSPEKTVMEKFGGGDEIPMMWLHENGFQYMENDIYQAIKLPYGNAGYAMTVLLPHEGKTVGDVLDAMDGKNWQFSSRDYEIDLKLPRFETEVSVDLKNIMKELGMPRAFDWQLAEFPYFCNRPVCIGQMKQAAKIKVDEEGTEAAAVTVIGMEATSIPPYAKMHVNRPFLYIISEHSTGNIFFIGQFMGNLTAGIDNLTPSPYSTSKWNNIYDLQGREMKNEKVKSKNDGALPKGIYIVNGHKVVIK